MGRNPFPTSELGTTTPRAVTVSSPDSLKRGIISTSRVTPVTPPPPPAAAEDSEMVKAYDEIIVEGELEPF